MALDSILTSSSSEQKWVGQMRQVFRKEVSIDIDTEVCIFQVSTTEVNNFKPDAYTPHLIALGPYHHFRPELYYMQRYKLDAAKQLLNEHQVVNFQHLVIDELKEFGTQIRACYKKYFDIDDETLAWIMAIDGMFLIHFLSTYNNNNNNSGANKDLTQNAVVRDIMMVENQVPIIVLRKIWRTLKLSSYDDDLALLMIHFCEAQSPLKLAQESPSSLIGKSAHLLDVMYQLILKNQIQVWKNISSNLMVESQTQPVLHHDDDDDDKEEAVSENMMPDESQLIQPPAVHDDDEEELLSISDIGEEIVDLNIPVAVELQKAFKFVHSLPWDTFSVLVKSRKQKLNQDHQTDPLIEEIEIPSVTELFRIAKIKFLTIPNGGGIRDIKFNEKILTFFLPPITLNPNSEVILKNLVSYEKLSTKPVGTGSSNNNNNNNLDLSHYVDLMSGIIDTPKDSSLLKEANVIHGSMNDKEIALLFNGMKKSSGELVGDVKSNLEKTFDEVNDYFENKPMVKVCKFLKKYIYASRKFLIVAATILLLLLQILQTFCQVYGCTRFFGMPAAPNVIGLQSY